MQMGNSPAHVHAALADQKKFNPSAGMAYEGKVIQVNPEDSTVDIAMYGGQILRRVRVLFNSANTVAGFRYLASIANTDSAQNSPNGIIDKGLLTNKADTLATVIYVQGQTLAPRVIGFSFPVDAQMHVNEQGLAMFRHESGFYSLVDKNGHYEAHFPDGSYIIASSDTSPKTMDVGPNSQAWNPATGPNINLTIHLTQGIDITIENGKMNIAGGTAAVARVGDEVTIPGVGTGTITSGSSKVFSG